MTVFVLKKGKAFCNVIKTFDEDIFCTGMKPAC